MSEFTYEDRQVVMQEQTMWNVVEILRGAVETTENHWHSQIKKIQDDARRIAKEMRDYNDQFETE